MHICDHSIVTFGTSKKCLGFSNTSHVESLDKFRRSVVDKVKTDICILKQGYHSKENNMKIKYTNQCFNNEGQVIQQNMFISSFTIK